MEFMYYPTFEFGDGRIIPVVRLPEDYLERVPRFYEREGKQEIRAYVCGLKKGFLSCGLIDSIDFEVNSDLVWDDERGLTTIRMRPSGGLDLEENGYVSFVEHNLGGIKSVFAGVVAMKYVNELWKCS